MIESLRFPFVVACVLGLAACAASPPHRPRLTQDDFKRLDFLEGRWRGVGPDGVGFYEQYDFPTPAMLRSQRYADAAFSAPNDSSTVTFANGEVISAWGKYRWKAAEITATRACFVPVQAPSAFCWEKTGADSVQVTQRWVDDKGQEQEVTMPMTRVR